MEKGNDQSKVSLSLRYYYYYEIGFSPKRQASLDLLTDSLTDRLLHPLTDRLTHSLARIMNWATPPHISSEHPVY